MPERTFPQVPQLTRPVYRDMNAQLENARAQWARMAPRVPQMPAEPPAVAAPFTPPVTVEQMRESRSQRAAGDLLMFLVVTLIVRMIQRWATRQQTPR